jgi:hypothetical protein
MNIKVNFDKVVKMKTKLKIRNINYHLRHPSDMEVRCGY